MLAPSQRLYDVTCRKAATRTGSTAVLLAAATTAPTIASVRTCSPHTRTSQDITSAGLRDGACCRPVLQLRGKLLHCCDCPRTLPTEQGPVLRTQLVLTTEGLSISPCTSSFFCVGAGIPSTPGGGTSGRGAIFTSAAARGVVNLHRCAKQTQLHRRQATALYRGLAVHLMSWLDDHVCVVSRATELSCAKHGLAAPPMA